MIYPFTMYGRIIQIHRYEVTYQEEVLVPKEEGPSVEAVERKEPVNTLEQAKELAERTGGSVTELDSSDYEWLDGIEVPDVPDTYAEAIKLYEMGQAAYDEEKNKPSDKEVISSLESQVTDLQMALCDMYETMEVTT